MHVSNSLAVCGLYLSSSALGALIAPQPRATDVLAARVAAPRPSARPRAHQRPRRRGPLVRPGPLLRPGVARGLRVGAHGHGGGRVHPYPVDAVPLPRLRPHHLDHLDHRHEHRGLRGLQDRHPRAAVVQVLHPALPVGRAPYRVDGQGGVDADGVGLCG
ncbi:hypothetical protein PG990_010963 [Apiospora arundinis]